MKNFFQKTYYFWNVTKIIFLIATVVSAIEIMTSSNLRPPEKLANIIAIIYALLLFIDLIMSAGSNRIKMIRYITGTISILIGLILFILAIKVHVISIAITLIFVFWIVLMGLFDLMQVVRHREETL